MTTNLDWLQIETEQPKSYAALIGGGGEDDDQQWVTGAMDREPVEHCHDSDEVWNDRRLFDFFDEKELYCTAEPGFDPNGQIESWTGCVSCLAPKGNGIAHYQDQGYGSREEAESGAFMKAFEILETWLNGQEYTKE